MRSSIGPLLLGLLAVPLLLMTCQKHLPDRGAGAEMIAEARAFVDSLRSSGVAVNYRAAQPKTVRWDLARMVPVGRSQGVLAPIVYTHELLIKANMVGEQLFHLDYLTQVLFYKDTVGKNTAFVMTSFPDSNFFKDPTRAFTGIRFIEDWQGHPVEKLLYLPGGQIRRYHPSSVQSAYAVVAVQTCYTISGYNYSPELDETESWTEDAGCSTDYIDVGSDGASGAGGAGGAGSGGAIGGGGSSGAGAASGVNVLPGNSVIKDIKMYFQCFTNVGGNDHHYTVTVAVNQPVPGTRSPWTVSGTGSSGSSAGGNPVYSGHAFLILSESYGATTITRNVGFYPATDVNPLTLNSQGTLNDDELHTYNVSGSFTVDNAQFFNILNFVGQGNTPGYLYNLNTNNCTTFVINALAQARISLPRTIGTWPDGAGNDPGDLGQDLRTTSVPGMTLDATAGNDASHLNGGQCN